MARARRQDDLASVELAPRAIAMSAHTDGPLPVEDDVIDSPISGSCVTPSIWLGSSAMDGCWSIAA